eukprot:692234-Amorphochlora_amoeboformis.AAC.1
MGFQFFPAKDSTLPAWTRNSTGKLRQHRQVLPATAPNPPRWRGLMPWSGGFPGESGDCEGFSGI